MVSSIGRGAGQTVDPKIKPLSFRYDDSEAMAWGKTRFHRVEVSPTKGLVWIYASFGSLPSNPALLVDAQPDGLQTITIGQAHPSNNSGRNVSSSRACQSTSGNSHGLPPTTATSQVGPGGKGFEPILRFGIAKDTHTGMTNRAFLLPWADNGKFDYYGPFARPRTPYDFKIKLDLGQGRLSVWVNGRGDDNWTLLADEIPTMSRAAELNAVRVEQNEGASGVELVIRSAPWPDGEKVLPHQAAKKDRIVAEGTGFRFQSMRSIWGRTGAHVTIARNNPNHIAPNLAWLGFPDVARVGPATLVCCFTGGGAHGGGGPMFACHSENLGKTWSKPKVVHPSGVNSSRVNILKDGSLIAHCDVRTGGSLWDFFYQGTDGGETWEDIGVLNPAKAGGHSGADPSQLAELSDGSWLLCCSWWTGDYWDLTEGEQLEIYRSTDRGKSWTLYSGFKEYPRSLSEVSLVPAPGGRLWMFIRETFGMLPGVKTYSDDNGKTWATCEELPFPIDGRTCAKRLADGRVLLTTRECLGRNGLWAWACDPEKNTQARIWGAHYNDSKSTGLKNGELYIDNDGACGQFTQYFLRVPDSPECRIDLTAEVKVFSNNGYAATLSVPYAGKLRIFPDHLQVAHEKSLRVPVTPGTFHTYRVVVQGGKMSLAVDGKEAFATDKVDARLARSPGTPVRSSPYVFGFGNEPMFPMQFQYNDTWAAACVNEWETNLAEPVPQLPEIPPAMMVTTGVRREQVTPRVTGCSVWRRVNARLEEPKTGVREQSWVAQRDGFPDQFQLDQVLEIQASTTGSHGLDQGYSGWVELNDGRIFVVNYTDDTAPACPSTPDYPTGLPWIRGTFVPRTDLPPFQSH
ncbi:MAG: glycoside hydrolase [Candidatus Omnitrophica bacterium]|nr:glycoside hydrolase [Candidatus Omnitrophota bacterium]